MVEANWKRIIKIDGPEEDFERQIPGSEFQNRGAGSDGKLKTISNQLLVRGS